MFAHKAKLVPYDAWTLVGFTTESPSVSRRRVLRFMRYVLRSRALKAVQVILLFVALLLFVVHNYLCFEDLLSAFFVLLSLFCLLRSA